MSAQSLEQQAKLVLAAYAEHHGEDHHGVSRIADAIRVATHAHDTQLRASGEPYITHPYAVAYTIADWGMDADSVIAALCHDVVEDTDVTSSELESKFGATVAQLVDGVTKLSAVTRTSREQSNAASLNKLLVAATRDPRVLIIKIADRRHNASTLGPLPATKRERVARETLDVYAPIAHRLGLNEAAAELEDSAFAALEPDLYDYVSSRMDELAPAREEKLARIKVASIDALIRAGLGANITSRKKHVYSTWRKTQVRKQELDAIADLIGIRVIVQDIASCYAALGVLHSTFMPVPGRFRDYVATPRFGQYQSLHTTLLVEGVVTEVQIRTWGMHVNAEQGISAHWRYKDQSLLQTDTRPVSVPELPWLAPLLDTGLVAEESAEEFLAHVRADLGADEVVIFTPDGDPLTLPDGATVLDAAYAIHTEVGNTCAAGLVNGVRVAKKTKVGPGDQVEIVTAENVRPALTWLEQAVTSRARQAIHRALNTAVRHDMREAATDALNTAIRRAGIGPGWWNAVSLDDLAPLAGHDHPHTLLEALVNDPEVADAVAEQVRDLLVSTNAVVPDASHDRGVLAGELSMDASYAGMLVTTASCCSPEAATEACGVVNSAGELIAHTAGCFSLLQTDSPIHEVTYAPTTAPCESTLTLSAIARRGLICEVTTIIEDAGVSIVKLAAATAASNITTVDMCLAATDEDSLWRAVESLGALEGARLGPAKVTTESG
jgi:guanosine-3',5'-bis(diphosphate) 3'-pyrophosphohydrolase